MADAAAQAFNQAHKGGHFAVFHGHAAGCLPQRYAFLRSSGLNVFHRTAANAACGHVDDAQQGIIVVGINRQPHISKCVFDLLPLIKAQATIDFIGQTGTEQGLLENARLGITTVKHSGLCQIHTVAVQGFDFFYHELGLFTVGKSGKETDFLTMLGFSAQVLAQAAVVMGNHGIGRSKDIAHRTVVLLQLDRRGYLKFTHEISHITHARATETVDALIVIAHGKYGRMLPGQKFEPIVLQFIGVLEFVYQDVVEAVLVVNAQNIVTLQHFIAAQHQFGKIRYPFLPTQTIVFGIAFN